MRKIRPKNHSKSEKLICDWTDEKKYLIHYRTLKFDIRHDLVVEKILEKFSFEQSKWLAKTTFVLILKNERELKMILRKTFSNCL